MRRTMLRAGFVRGAGAALAPCLRLEKRAGRSLQRTQTDRVAMVVWVMTRSSKPLDRVCSVVLPGCRVKPGLASRW